MPKEQINYPQVREQITPGDKAPSAVCVHVGWNRAGWVQISLASDPGYFEQMIADVGEGDGEAAAYSDVLDRVQINHLIRALRKARDQAYGADA